MTKAQEGGHSPKGYTSREVLWRIISRASLADYGSVTDYVEAIKKAKTELAELGHHYTWEITSSILHGLPPSYETFVDIVLNSRGKDSTGKLLEPDFDDVVERVLERERGLKLTFGKGDDGEFLFRGGENKRNSNRTRKRRYGDCSNVHGKLCFFQRPDLAPGWWLERIRDRVNDYNKRYRKPKISRIA